ncbi:hypothetical protein [Streptomyces sp. GS7]|uniref:hypothetical protein n=1 Tax=Streptomyces sp. GS7 TaxID=2692234 RepID=UPI0013198CE0|nr:hypothetical protein [Streptomyces sp. GS7]QHC24907.1 hypothetical protein GR130_29600 [Streptomyces sp. GS7]
MTVPHTARTSAGSARWRRFATFAVLLTTALAWCRAALYTLQRDEVRAAVAGSPRLSDTNRAFVAEAQDMLQWAWWGFPALLLVLTAIALVLRVGQFLLIGVSGMVGPALAASGFLFPGTVPLQVLAALFFVTLVCSVAATVLPGRPG